MTRPHLASILVDGDRLRVDDPTIDVFDRVVRDVLNEEISFAQVMRSEGDFVQIARGDAGGVYVEKVGRDGTRPRVWENMEAVECATCLYEMYYGSRAGIARRGTEIESPAGRAPARRTGKRDWKAWILWVAAVYAASLAGCVLVSFGVAWMRGKAGSPIFARLVLSAFASVFVLQLIYSLKTGVRGGRFFTHGRDEQPVRFWSDIAFDVLVCAGLLTFAGLV